MSRTNTAGQIAAFARACHFPPTVAVTVIITAYGASLGWRGGGLVGVLFAVLLSQLSVGWSNDAFDAPLDLNSGRTEKPTVAGLISARVLWRAAAAAFAGSATLSWVTAGWIGGSFLVAATAMAWLYNVALSRTVWSWLPYAVAFGSVPAFLTLGLDGRAPALWTVVVFAILGVSAHLANALPDLESDRAAGRKGIAVTLGAKRTTLAGWALLGVGSSLLAVESRPISGWLPVAVGVGFFLAVAYGTRSRRRQAAFFALLAVFGLDAVVFAIASR